jgi:membrane-associated phospholipid phosphatase
MVVPAYGPWLYLNGQFSHELHGGFWWPLVRKTVSAAGSRTDVFPSLHTGGPTFLALFSFRHRKLLPFKYTWPVVAFFATQIVAATMFLRWHYLVDIVAGFSLATTIVLVAPRVLAWERARRANAGLEPTWTPLPWPRFGGSRFE